MTPKEKAKQLYIDMLSWQDNSIEYLERDVISISAKKCALILVSEMKKQCWDYRDIDIQLSYDYWVQVEQEILKLCSK
jgi:hypothetical protein